MYLLPAVPALAMALAPLLPGLLARSDVQRTLWVAATGIALGLGLAAGSALLGEPRFEQRLLQQNGVAPWGWLSASAALGVLACLLLWRKGAHAFAAVMGLLWTGYGLFGYADMDGARSGRDLMERAAGLLPADAALGIVGGPEQFLLQGVGDVRAFGFKTPLAHQRQLADDWLRESDRHWMLIQRTDKDDCIDPTRAIEVGMSNRRHWFLLDATALRAGCIPPAPRETSPLHFDTDD